jgi:catechol 2,3-dioxygenase-like lactoylglutathione lyase family enzyme
MAWDVDDKEFEAVVGLTGPERYAYFIKRAASHGELWALADVQGLVIAEDDAGEKHVPVWPHPRYAAACAQGPWTGATPESIDIDDWVEAWLPRLRDDGLRIAVFQTPNDQGVAVGTERLKADLEEDLSGFELG